MASEADKIFSRVTEFIKRNAMLDDSEGLVVAVSGGPDSMALLDIVLRAGRRLSRPAAKPVTLHVAHLDHQLRAESSADAEFVRMFCRARGLDCTFETRDVREAARIAKKGIEETARRLRYAFLTRVAAELGADRIAVGHTMNDQAETLVMRLIRGSGPRGLGAMRPVTTVLKGSQEGPAPAPAGSHVPRAPLLIRPLLCLTREEVEDYCKFRRLEFRVDATNAAPDFLRNRVRQSVIPLLSELNKGAVRSIARVAEATAIEHDLLASRAQRLLQDARPRNVADASGECENRYSVAGLRGRPSPLRRMMLVQAIEQARADANASGQVTSAQVLAVEQLLAEGKSGKRVELGGGISAWREFNELVFVHGEAPSTISQDLNQPGATQGAVEFGGVRVTVERRKEPRFLEKARDEARLSRQTGRNWLIALIDEAELPDRLVVRARREGDRAGVVGQSGTKRLKSLMIDHRIPSSRRSTWPIVTTPDDRYVWSPGLPPARDFAVRDGTPSFAILRASIL